MTEPLPDKFLGTGLGKFEPKLEGRTVMIMSGMYQICTKSAYRGFKMPKDFSWFDKLEEIGNKSIINLSFEEAKSWIAAVFQNKPEEINRFLPYTKMLDLNKDSKRIWLSKTTGTKLLSGLEQSMPKVYIEPYNTKRL
jgi:hypothetical protein